MPFGVKARSPLNEEHPDPGRKRGLIRNKAGRGTGRRRVNRDAERLTPPRAKDGSAPSRHLLGRGIVPTYIFAFCQRGEGTEGGTIDENGYQFLLLGGGGFADGAC